MMSPQAIRYGVAASTALFLIGVPALAQTRPATTRPATDWSVVGDALAKAVADDPRAAALYAPLKKTADAAMDEPPDPIARIRSEGLLAGDPLKARTAKAVRDMGKLSALTWSALVGRDPRHAARAVVYLRAWADVNRSAGNPIDDTRLDPAVFAYTVVRPHAAEADRVAIEAWFRQIVDAHTKARQNKNNWQNHRIKIVGLIGYALADAPAVAFAEAAWREQLGRNLRADGSTSDFHERDALHYHLYGLDPLLRLAAAADAAGVGYYQQVSADGASLAKSVAFLVPYATGEKRHVEFVNSKAPFDRKRAANGENGYAGHDWQPKNAMGVFTRASLFDPAYDVRVAALAGMPEAKYASWDALVVAVRRDVAPLVECCPVE